MAVVVAAMYGLAATVGDEWQNRGIEKGREYAILTNEITHAWSGMNTQQYKKFSRVQTFLTLCYKDREIIKMIIPLKG